MDVPALEEIRTRTVGVSGDDRTVTVDGLCVTFHIPEDLPWASMHWMTWDTSRPKPGFVSQPGDAFWFDDWERFAPFVVAWHRAATRLAEEARAEQRRQQEAAEAARLADLEAARQAAIATGGANE